MTDQPKTTTERCDVSGATWESCKNKVEESLCELEKAQSELETFRGQEEELIQLRHVCLDQSKELYQLRKVNKKLINFLRDKSKNDHNLSAASHYYLQKDIKELLNELAVSETLGKEFQEVYDKNKFQMYENGGELAGENK